MPLAIKRHIYSRHEVEGGEYPLQYIYSLGINFYEGIIDIMREWYAYTRGLVVSEIFKPVTPVSSSILRMGGGFEITTMIHGLVPH